MNILASFAVLFMLLGNFPSQPIVAPAPRAQVDLVVFEPFCRPDRYCDISADFTINKLLQYNPYVYWRGRVIGEKWTAWTELHNDHVQLRVPWEPGDVIHGQIQVIYIGTPAGSGMISRTFTRILPLE